jgi:hypothetical protein
MATISKLAPHRTMYLRGFDRRGCCAAMTQASASGFQVSGAWNDQADFVVLMLFDADDLYGHLLINRYLPNFSLAGVTLDFDLAIDGCMWPLSQKYQSVPWGMLSYIDANENPGTVALPYPIRTTGMVAASTVFSIVGTPTNWDRIQIVYLGNVIFDLDLSILTTVSFSFQNSYGTGYSHFITVGGATYTYVQLAGDSNTAIVTALAALINAGPGDPNVVASVNSNQVTLTERTGRPASVSCSASDGNTSALLTGMTLARVAASMAALINHSTSATVPLWAGSEPISTTIAANIAPGTQTVTVAFVGNIVVGSALTVANADGSNSENVVVTAVTTTTFTATFASSKTGPGITVQAGVLTITSSQPGRDANSIEFMTMYKTAGKTQIVPFGRASLASGQTTKLIGGLDPISTHFHLDFSALGLASCRQIWLTLAPWMPYPPSTVSFSFANSFGTGYSHTITVGGLGIPQITYTYVQLAGDSSAAIAWALAALITTDPNVTAVANSDQVTLTLRNDNISVQCQASDDNDVVQLGVLGVPSLLPFSPMEFSMVFSNWTLTDPNGVTPLKVAGAGSVTVGSRDAWATYAGTDWSEQAGFYYKGFTRQSSNATDSVTVTYWCQSVHNLYLGTALSASGGTFSVSIDGGAASNLSTYADALSPIATRRLVPGGSGLAAGQHTVVFTVASGTCLFDYLQAAVPADPVSAAKTYSNVSAAADFDTDQTYKLPPARVLWNYQQFGLLGDLDFYAGVFFALKRVRNGGSFHTATITLAGIFGIGTGWGDGDSFFVTIAGTELGVAMYPADNPNGSTLVQRLIDAINGTFVGVYAAPTIVIGQFTVTTLSPINGFTISVSKGSASTGAIDLTGDIKAGTEGTWQVDSTQSMPINRAFSDYLADLCALWHAAGMSVTVAWSQELLAPPDANTSDGAWIQRFQDGSTVLTDTGFGTWGAGFVEAVSGSSPMKIQETGHGYITGNTVHIASSTGSGVWEITVTDANHYQLTTQISNSGEYTPAVGDAVSIDLQTSQCAFNPSTVTPYLSPVYVQTAQIMAAAGLTPWLQFGEILHWFFSGGSPASMAYYDANQAAAAQAALGRALATLNQPTDDPSINGYADANFLRERIKAHIDGVRTAVLAVVPGAKFELLWPYDVNYPTQNAYGVGGRLNRYVNLPVEYQQQSGSGLNRLKMEALSFGSQERNFTKALQAMSFPWTAPMAWTRATAAYLIPWDNGGCPWDYREWLAVSDASINPSGIGFWAIDHLVLFSWRLPLPTPTPSFQIQ